MFEPLNFTEIPGYSWPDVMTNEFQMDAEAWNWSPKAANNPSQTSQHGIGKLLRTIVQLWPNPFTGLHLL